MDFTALVGAETAARLARDKITTPTEIQRTGIPVIQSGRSAALISKTGTGKTLAYLLPVIGKLDLSIKAPQAFIVAPTHELAAQIYKTARHILEGNPAQAALIIGGADIQRQLQRLKEKPRIIIGSAGRITELIKLKKLSAHYVKTIVLDEADRMFDEQNAEAAATLIKTTLKDRQLILASASISDRTVDIAGDFVEDIEIIKASSGYELPGCIRHIYFLCEQREKFDAVRKLIHSDENKGSDGNIKKTIIFSNDISSIELLTKRLNYHGITAAALYGEAGKKERKQALLDFDSGRVSVLVASDVAARGLDIGGILFIISLEVPENPIHYLHRAGRCGRAGCEGTSVIITERRELDLIKRIEKKLSITLVKKVMRFGKILDS